MVKNKSSYLLDTNIIVGVFRGVKECFDIISTLNIKNIYISDITFIEIIIGCKNILTRNRTLELLKDFNVKETASTKTMLSLSKRYAHTQDTDRLKVPDLLIASSAIDHNMILVTNNRKDFDFIKELTLYNPQHTIKKTTPKTTPKKKTTKKPTKATT